MNGDNLLNGLGYVDDEFIQEAEQNIIKRPRITYLIPLVASIAFVIGGFSIWLNHQGTTKLPQNDSKSPSVVDNSQSDNSTIYTLNFNKVNSIIPNDMYIEGHFYEDLTSDQANMILPNFYQNHKISGTVNYSYRDGKTTIFNIEAIVMINDKDIKITIAPNEITKCYIILGEPKLSNIEGVDVEASIFKTDRNSQGQSNYIYSADFKIDDVAYYVEYSANEDDSEYFTNVVADIILGGKAELSIFNPVVPELGD